MTYARIIDDVKYVCLMNDNDFKKISLYDNVYFTLRDIFANSGTYGTVMEANYFNGILTNNIYFEDRTENFKYSNELHQSEFVRQLQNWLNNLDIYDFEFEEPTEDEEIDMKEYMKWDDWWVQFEELRKLINEQYAKCLRWEEEDIERDTDRLTELEYDDEC